MLRQRVITAVIAGAALLVVLFALPAAVTRIVIAGLLLVGAWEWSAFLGAGATGRGVFMAVCAALILPHATGYGDILNVRLVLQIALAWWSVAFVWTFFYPTPIPAVVAWLAGILVIVPAYVALDWLYTQSVWVLLMALAPVWCADIGAYFAGKKFGRVKLAPAISPGKTWEGVIGGMLSICVLVIAERLLFGIQFATLLPLSLAAGAISVIGDLTVSMFKRHRGVKDSGGLFPGHGGFLDRADGITAASPVFALGLLWIGGPAGLVA